MQKDSSIQALEMDFEGKNIMLYSLGNYIPLNNPNEPIPHICKGIATSEHWWRLSNHEQSKRSGKCNECKINSDSKTKIKKENINNRKHDMKRREFDEDIFEGMSEMMMNDNREIET